MDIIDRVNKLSKLEIASLANGIRNCLSYPELEAHLTDNIPLTHICQAEIRTMFAREEFPISEAEVKAACSIIIDRDKNPLSHFIFPEEIFPQEIC